MDLKGYRLNCGITSRFQSNLKVWAYRHLVVVCCCFSTFEESVTRWLNCFGCGCITVHPWNPTGVCGPSICTAVSRKWQSSVQLNAGAVLTCFTPKKHVIGTCNGEVNSYTHTRAHTPYRVGAVVHQLLGGDAQGNQVHVQSPVGKEAKVVEVDTETTFVLRGARMED